MRFIDYLTDWFSGHRSHSRLDDNTYYRQSTTSGVSGNISCQWNNSSWSVLLKYAFGSHISTPVRSLGKPTISARSTVEDIFIAAATSKTEEQERERCFFYLEQCVDQG